MTITERYSTRVKEKYIKMSFENGLDVYVIPKNTSSASAVFAVNFGSCDTVCIDDKNEKFNVIEGSAHFLEHKMFETKEGDAFEQYAAFGGDANAYTAGDKTVYLFSATDNVYDNLRVLLKHVTNPHFTERSVKKEKGIIIQELKMYLDNPSWQCHRAMMRCLYGDTSLSADPGGTVESVTSITKKDLEACRNFAYRLSDMALCVCGNVDADKVAEVVNEVTGHIKPRPKYVPEPIPFGDIDVVPFASAEFDVSLPLFSVGIRLDKNGAVGNMKEFAAIELIVTLLFGQSGDFYSDCYENGLFESFGSSYQTMRKAFFIELSGYSKQPEKLYKKIKERIRTAKKNGFDANDFERVKKAHYADLVYDFDSPDSVTDSFISFALEGDDMFDYPDITAEITKEYAEECLNFFSDDCMCLSLITPKEERK